MSMIGYEVPITWEPDTDYINTPPDYQYLAWRLGTNTNLQTALWVIVPVVPNPTPLLTDLLPVGYKEIYIDDDTQKFGYTRDAYPGNTIAEVEAIIETDKRYVEEELI